MTATLHRAVDVLGVQCVSVLKEVGKPKMLASNVGYSKFLLETLSTWTLANGAVLEWEAIEWSEEKNIFPAISVL